MKDNLRGSLLMVLSMFCFAVEDTLIKLMSASLPVGQILLMIGVGGFLAFALWAMAQGQPPLTRTMLRGPSLLRAVCEGTASLGFVAALSLVPISVVTTIIQANPLLVTLGASLVFGETVGWRRWSAIIAGLLGVLIVLRPFGDGFQLAALFAVMGVMAQTGRDLATRRISKDISTQQLSGLGFLALAPAGIVALLVTGDGIVWPDGHAWLLLIGAIGIGLPALYAIIAAVRIGDISFIAPFRYTRIVFGLAAGALVFHETLDGYTVLGATVIVASGLYMLLREAQLRRASKRYATAL